MELMEKYDKNKYKNILKVMPNPIYYSEIKADLQMRKLVH